MIRTHKGVLIGTSGVLGEYLTEEQVAAEFDISVRTLIRWRRLRKAPAHTRVGRRIIYHLSDVQSWLASRRAEVV